MFDNNDFDEGSKDNTEATQFTRETMDGLSAAASKSITLEDSEDVLVRGHEARLSAAQLKLLEVQLAESTGLDKSVISAAAREAKNTMRPYGNVGTFDGASQAYCTMVDEACPPENDLPGFVWSDDTWWAFDQDENHYAAISTEKLTLDLRETFKGRPVVRTERDVKEVLHRVAERYRADNFFADAARGLPMANGFARYNQATGRVELEGHVRGHKSRFCLDVDFSRDATAPTFHEGLRRVLPDAKKRQALQEVMGCLAFQAVPQRDAARRMVILTGRGGSGKSTFIETAKLIVPPELTVSVSPAKWNCEFSRARLAGKWLNYCTELPRNRLVADDQLKQIVACETVTARQRYGQEYEIQPTALHVIATNVLPHIYDTSGALDRRLLVIDFDQPLAQSEMDNNFLGRVREEIAGIIAWAAEGAERLMQRGAFDLPQGHAEGMLKMKFKDDVIALFAHTQLERAPGRRVSSAELQAALRAFADPRGFDRMSVTGSGPMRRLSGIMEGVYGAERSSSNNAPYYTGVVLKGAAAPPAPDDGLAGL